MKANKVVLFYNSYSGAGTFAQELDKIIGRFQQNGKQVFPYKTDRTPEPMIEYLNSLDKESVCEVIIAGGDGTVDLCVNALIQADYHVPISIFPTGTANDMANHLNIPRAVAAMLDVAISGYPKPFDVGRINDSYFVNEASLGVIIDVSQKTSQKVKNSIGMLGYYIEGLKELPQIKPFKVKLSYDGIEEEESIYFMLIMNGNTAGGFKRLAPYASTSDGKFDIIVFRECPPAEFFNLLLKVLKRTHISSPYVNFIRTSRIRIDSEKPVSTDVDGEKGPDLPLDIEVIPSRFKVLVPRAIR